LVDADGVFTDALQIYHNYIKISWPAGSTHCSLFIPDATDNRVVAEVTTVG